MDTKTNKSTIGISRADLLGPALRLAVIDRAGADAICSDHELEQSRAHSFGHVKAEDEVWIFAYGSLMWNPIFPVAELRTARVHGYHRSFCVNSTLGRGSKERPGLMLALDAGGACAGVALKMARDGRDEELRLLWRREMLLKSYRPVWVKVHTGEGEITALTFVADRQARNYLGRLQPTDIANRIAGAAGLLGSNLDYLIDACDALFAYGIIDPYLSRLLALCHNNLEAKPASTSSTLSTGRIGLVG